MKLLRAIAVAAAIFVLAPPPPASAQISPNAVWSCEFTNSPTDCGLCLEAVASNRATIVSPGRDGPTAVQLTTQPGDINIAGSGSNDRADLVLARSSTYCNQGQDEWWAHSLMFPPGYVPPPVASVWNWGALFDFHNSSPGGGQPNFMVYATPTGLELHMAGGPNTVNLPSDPGYYSIAIGPITKNVWYDFVYHVKWSSGADGLFQAWLNGQQVMNYSGANLYVGQSCYLKIANYHTELGVPVSVVHSRVVMGHTQADVQIGSPPPPTVLVPNVVGQMQAAATSAIISAGLTLGTDTMQSSTTEAPGNVISRALADHVAGGHRSARLHRDRTEGEARADDGARGRRLHLANHIRHQHSGRRRGPDLHIGLGVAHHNARVDDADGHAELGMVVGDLEITALADIEVGAAVVHDLLAVEPRLEEAVRTRRPLHVIHEVVPDVLGDRADHDAVVAGIARQVDGVWTAGHMELEARGRGVDHEVGLSAARGGVVKVEERAPVPDRSNRWGHIARRKHERVRPPLVLSLVAVGRGSCEHQIGAVVRAAASDIDVTRLRSQLHRRGTVAPGTHDRGAIGRDRL